MPFRQRLLRTTGGAEQALQPADSVNKLWFSVWGQAHDLELVTIAEESQMLRDGRVKHPQRVREADLVQNFEAVIFAKREGCADEITETVERTNGGLLERRDKEGAGQMCGMVFDIMNLRQLCHAYRKGLG